MKRRCRETGACLDREKLGLFYFFKFSINPEIADISQPKPIIINAIFHPIPLSKTKINVYRANKGSVKNFVALVKNAPFW